MKSESEVQKWVASMEEERVRSSDIVRFTATVFSDDLAKLSYWAKYFGMNRTRFAGALLTLAIRDVEIKEGLVQVSDGQEFDVERYKEYLAEIDKLRSQNKEVNE